MGRPQKKYKSGWVEFVGTDLHHDRHMEFLKKYKFDADLSRLFQNYPVRNSEL
jgi:protein-tyrosine phosphatase